MGDREGLVGVRVGSVQSGFRSGEGTGDGVGRKCSKKMCEVCEGRMQVVEYETLGTERQWTERDIRSSVRENGYRCGAYWDE